MTTDAGPVLTVRDAARRYGEVRALDGASLELRPGEWIGLLGPNGAGKTTLVRAIAGRVALDEGVIALNDVEVTRGATRSAAGGSDLGVVPQDIALYPTLTVGENLHAFGRLHGVSPTDIRARIDWALEWTGLAERRTARVNTLSGGMKRRLNIACAVMHRPAVILLDEPTVGVDPQSRHRIWTMLGQLRDDGAALLLTTHQLDEAQHVCERIIIIDHGRTIASGTFLELLRETIGTRQRVRLELSEPVPESFDATRFTRLEANVLARDVDDVADDLPGLLESVRSADLRIEDLRVESPTLQAVFLHLTGRELRE